MEKLFYLASRIVAAALVLGWVWWLVLVLK